jgi:hypothetical protein
MGKPALTLLSEHEQKQLLHDLNYLNTAEIKSFCKRHSIPYTIAIEAAGGQRRKTNEDDRKGVILKRIRHYLRTGLASRETLFRSTVVRCDSLPETLLPGDRLFYGQYAKTNRTMIALLKSLTQGRFHDGAVARILARDFWSRGKAPTFEEYASAWQLAANHHSRPNAEWAFLADRARGTAGPDWKRLRAKKAAKVIKTLRQITGT